MQLLDTCHQPYILELFLHISVLLIAERFDRRCVDDPLSVSQGLGYRILGNSSFT